jgi:hypothetical protein
MTRVCAALVAVAVAVPAGRVAAADPPDAEAKRLAKELEAARKQIDALRKENERLTELLKKATADREKAIAAPRGKVTAHAFGQVTVSVGTDAGVTTGSILNLYRPADGKAARVYLGWVVVQRVTARDAVGTFRPVSGREATKLKPEERPTAGDAADLIFIPPLAMVPGLTPRAPDSAREPLRTVAGYKDGVVTFLLERDAKVKAGASFVVARLKPDVKVLGMMVVEKATATEASGTFRLIDRKKKLADLTPDELPQAGDYLIDTGEKKTDRK